MTRLTIALALILLTLIPVQARDTICPKKSDGECAGYLKNYPLFDTPYKIAANYTPVLALRAIAHADVYREKKSFHIERFYYVKNLEGELGKAYQSLILDVDISGFGIFNRKIKAKGKLNEFDFEYENSIGFSLPKKANLKIEAKIDEVKFLDLKVKSDGDEMTNEVEGSFFNEKVDYHTKWRDTEGILSNHAYKIHAEGVVEGEDEFQASSHGYIGNYPIYGNMRMVTKNNYQGSEDYGPITVKTFITIKD